MSKYIIDILGEVDEKLLEEALDLPQQADEVVLESDERRRRGSIFGAAAAIAASLAVVAGVVLFRANFGRIAALPNEGGSSDIPDSGITASGIIIPNEFTKDDKELQQILNDINNDALEICKAFGYYSQSPSFDDAENKNFLFPQMEKPITFQFDKFHYYSGFIFPIDYLLKQIENSFTAEAAACLTNDFDIGKGVIIDADELDLTVRITEGGEFDENGYLTKPPFIIEIEDGPVYLNSFGGVVGRDLSGYWSTAKVISKTDGEIIFSYIREINGELSESKGRLLNENGWKFSWCGDWIF